MKPIHIALSRKQKNVYDAVAATGNNGIITDRLIDVLYSDQADGGPLDAKKCLRRVIYKANKKLHPYGKRIVGSSRGNQHTDNYYRLVESPTSPTSPLENATTC